jgi:succinylglutamic semialdehyde dehydrogenase
VSSTASFSVPAFESPRLDDQAFSLVKTNPSTGAVIWRGLPACPDQVRDAVARARKAAGLWQRTSHQERTEILERFGEIVRQEEDDLARLVSTETGKPFWEARQEAQAVWGKIALTIEADQRADRGEIPAATGMRLRLVHRPLGVIAILGPFNMPAHLPHGQIAPALLAGNAVVFKPSPLAPATADWMLERWARAGLPVGVLQVLHGGGNVGQWLAEDAGIDGVFFTGSRKVGGLLHRALAGFPERLLALEMGGNNPLLLGSCANHNAALDLTLESAFITAGQRCTCARRLIVRDGASADAFLEELAHRAGRIRLGSPTEQPEPFLGPVIDAPAARRALEFQEKMLRAGAVALRPLEQQHAPLPFLRPGILIAPRGLDLPDEEVFAPLLMVQKARDFSHALALANATRFGLAAGLLSDSLEEFEMFSDEIQAGVVNWNCPTTGASGRLPFGGLKASGNHRPAGWTMRASCHAPVAVKAAPFPLDHSTPPPGLRG